MLDSDPTRQFEKEDRAIKAARELVAMRAAYLAYRAKVREVGQLFRDANMTPLPSVAALLTEGSDSVAPPGKPKVIVTPPPEPPRPKDHAKDWIWVRMTELTPQTLILALLRGVTKPVPVAELYRQIREYDPQASQGSIQNVGTRLDGSLIHRDDYGWSLIDESKAPLVEGKYAWGTVGAFQPPEVAVYRRHLIRHVLRAERGGMQLVDIYRRLKDSGFFPGVNKDQVKGDLEVLDSKGEVERTGKPARPRWVLTNHEEETL